MLNPAQSGLVLAKGLLGEKHIRLLFESNAREERIWCGPETLGSASCPQTLVSRRRVSYLLSLSPYSAVSSMRAGILTFFHCSIPSACSNGWHIPHSQ